MIKINEIYPDLINKFPAEIDPIRQFLDVTAETKPLVDEYYRLYNSGNTDGATKLIQDNPILQKMIINAYAIQYLYDMNIAMQRFYMNDVQQYLVNIVAYQNTFEDSKKYKKYNVVNYTVAGAKEAYMCTDNNTPIGTLPTNIKYWVALTLRGEKGDSGTGLAWRGRWDSTITYFKDDCVSRNNILWAAKRENINSAPDDVNDDWEYALKLDIKAQDVICKDGNNVENKLSEIDTKLTETNKSIATIKSTTYTKSETDLNRTYTLTHSKSGAVHTFTELPTTNGIYQCQFVAVADYAEGETFADGYTAKPNGEETMLPDKAFVTGDLVSVVVDTEKNKLGFKLGGSTYGTLSPQIRNFAAKVGNHQITLSWTNPSDSNFAGLYLVRKHGSMPTKLSDGVKIDVGKATSYTDNEPENCIEYYYRAFTYNAKKQVQTELTGAVVSATPSSFILPTFTGQHAIFGDSTKGRLEMYTSGTLTLQSSSYDVFAVGGGGAGYKNDEGYPNGAGGGYVETIKNKTLSGNYVVTIGAGGIQGEGTSDGGATHFTDVAHADGGADSFSGGNGGSGGGGGTRGSGIAGDGGTDGSDGKPSSDGNKGGTGQHVTTKAFGDIDSVSYSGGGGGYSASGNHGLGKDGGGNGGGGKGTANTGGGGGGGTGSAGGSGIAIIRWGY